MNDAELASRRLDAVGLHPADAGERRRAARAVCLCLAESGAPLGEIRDMLDTLGLLDLGGGP